MKKNLQFELAPFPLSLFNEGGMRKSQKSAFCSLFIEIPILSSQISILHVVDGGYLLQHFVWGSVNKVSQIIQGYVSYVERHFVILLKTVLLCLTGIVFLVQKFMKG